MENTNTDPRQIRPVHRAILEEYTNEDLSLYEWRADGNTLEAVKISLTSINRPLNDTNNPTVNSGGEGDEKDDEIASTEITSVGANNGQGEGSVGEYCQSDMIVMRASPLTQDAQGESGSNRHLHCDDTVNTTRMAEEERSTLQPETSKMGTFDSGIASITSLHNTAESMASIRSIGSFVCRICHNAEQPERLVSPCLCKGSLMYVHIYCLEHWISTSGKTTCELCQFRYKTVQTLRYTCLQSLRMWYSHSMSRRALQEDCQMFSLLTLVAFGIVGTIFVGIQYYVVQEKHHMPTMTRMYTKSWLMFFLVSTFVVYFINVYMIVRGQLAPWYRHKQVLAPTRLLTRISIRRWWQSAREIKLILENRKTANSSRKLQKPEVELVSARLQDTCRNVTTPTAREEGAIGSIFLNLYTPENGENDNRRNALIPIPNETDDTSRIEIDNQQMQQHQQQLQQTQQRQHQDV